ncbi:hypothetical protein [Aeromonas sp. R9-2]|uniref:hypothetical protein n=1 Tax=Aeromonas sp. R9-2 TaxID=3138479 RepID=UPI0034A17F20
MKHFFIEWVNTSELDDDIFIAMKHIMKSLLSDEEVLTVYNLHYRFRISPVSLFKAIHLLSDFDLIKFDNMTIYLLPVDDEKMSIINFIYRTKKPKKLNSPINWLTRH